MKEKIEFDEKYLIIRGCKIPIPKKYKKSFEDAIKLTRERMTNLHLHGVGLTNQQLGMLKQDEH